MKSIIKEILISTKKLRIFCLTPKQTKDFNWKITKTSNGDRCHWLMSHSKDMKKVFLRYQEIQWVISSIYQQMIKMMSRRYKKKWEKKTRALISRWNSTHTFHALKEEATSPSPHGLVKLMMIMMERDQG